MGAFQLIENKQFQKFCELYERKSHLRATTADYADLMPGNYMRALLGAKKIEQLIEFCQNEVKRREQIDRTTTDFYIGLSIGYFLQNNFDKAGKALIDGSKAKYQDIARTEVACIMYWESVSTHNDVLKRESKKILKNRLRAKVSPHNLVTAAFLLDRCDENDMHSLIDGIENSILKYRALVLCYFCIAAKQLERGDQNGYSEALRQVCMLYDKCSHAVKILPLCGGTLTHIWVFLRHRREFQHILLPVIEDGKLLAVCAGVCLVPFLHICKVNDAHAVTPFPSADTFPGDTTPVPS